MPRLPRTYLDALSARGGRDGRSLRARRRISAPVSSKNPRLRCRCAARRDCDLRFQTYNYSRPMGVVVQRARICFRLRISLAAGSWQLAADPARGPSRGVSAFRAVALLAGAMDGVGGCQAYARRRMAARPRARITRSLWRVRYRCGRVTPARIHFFGRVEKSPKEVYPAPLVAYEWCGVYNEKRDTIRPIFDCRVFTRVVRSDVRHSDSRF